MILLAFVLVTLLALIVVMVSHDHLWMNSVCILQAFIFTALVAYIVLFQNIPVDSFVVGSQYFFIDHLGLFEAGIATVIFTCAAIYARGYIEGLLQSGELEKSSLKFFYTAWALLLLIIVLAFFSDDLALFWIFAELTTIILCYAYRHPLGPGEYRCGHQVYFHRVRLHAFCICRPHFPL